MKFKMNLEGMHCMGCVNLILTTLEDEGFTNVIVSLNENFAEFESLDNKDEIEAKLSKAFSVFNQYKFNNLVQI